MGGLRGNYPVILQLNSLDRERRDPEAPGGAMASGCPEVPVSAEPLHLGWTR